MDLNKPSIKRTKTHSRSNYFDQENKRLIILPLQIIASLVVIVGSFALMFEVAYFAEFSFELYFGRLIATFIGFVILVMSNFSIGQKNPTLLIHILLLTIIASFASIIIKIPSSIYVNSHLLALLIFTSALFLNWDLKNQIIVAIYYNILFATSLLVTDKSIYYLPSMYASVVFVIVISMLSIIASSINYRLRQNAIDKTFEARDLFENSTEAIFKVRCCDYTFVTGNPSFFKLFKVIDENAFYSNFNFKDIFDDIVTFNALAEQSQGTEEILNLICKLRDTENNTFVGLMNVRVIKESGKDQIYLEGSLRDITKEKQAEDKIRKYNVQLEMLNDSKDKFFSIVAHDLISPFSAVLGYSEILLEESEEMEKSQVKQFATDIHSISQKAFNLLNELLDWSRIQTGRMPYEPEVISLRGIVQDLFTLYEQNAKKKSIQLISSIADDQRLFADYKMISTTLRNLLSNAIKFTPNGGTIEIGSETRDNEVEVYVRDTGIGIKVEDMDKIFKIDVHHTQIGTNKEKGTGLGLILCQEFIQKNGGRIWVESEFDKGSKFLFTLPVNPPT